MYGDVRGKWVLQEDVWEHGSKLRFVPGRAEQMIRQRLQQKDGPEHDTLEVTSEPESHLGLYLPGTM